jgi:PAS domain S-box-containing protein
LENKNTGLEGILNAIPSPVFVLDLEGRVLHWNRSIALLTGISKEDIAGRIFVRQLLFPENVADWEHEFQRIVESASPVRAKYRLKLGADRSMEVTSSISVIRDAGCVVFTIIADHEEIAAERKDVSRFLHDTITQDLVALSFTISKLQSQTDGAEALDLIDRCCRDIRLISYILAPPSTGEAGLGTAIEWYTEYLEEAGIETDIEFAPGVDESLSLEATDLFLTAIQEWTARLIRRRLKARLFIGLHRNGSGIVLELKSVVSRRMATGWTTFRERVRTLGGSFEVTDGPAEVTARLYLPGSGPE